MYHVFLCVCVCGAGALVRACVSARAHWRVCAVALVPYLPRMQSTWAVLSSVATLDAKYILTPHKHHDFREKIFEHKMFILIFLTNFI